MNCPECRADNREGARFCEQCGAALVSTCGACGATLGPGARFCSQCGARVAEPSEPAPPEREPAHVEALQRLVPREFAERLRATRGRSTAERRTVTILFCDVVGSTAMARDLDPEEVTDIMAGAFEVLIPPIYRHEGTVARLMGDAVLAFFGAPISHEDDPERAIRASLEIIAGAREYASRLEGERGIEGFKVRIGINTGLVVVGEVGSDLRVEYTAMGDAINLAARMEQSAPPGSIMITHETYRRVRGIFDVAPQEPIVIKGVAEPVRTYLVQREKPRALRLSMRGVEGVETSFVGRGPELLFLQDAYRDVLADAEARVVTIVGDAGVGKSRLLEELSNWIELRPERVWYLRGQAAASTQGVPYSLWRDLFAFRFNILESDAAETALTKFREGMDGFLGPDQADVVGHLVGFDLSSSDAVRAALDALDLAPIAVSSLSAYLRGLMELGPIALFLEDLHWADDSSLDLLANLVSELGSAPLLIVAAARPALYERRPSWGEGRTAFIRLDLKPLSRRAGRALVAQILGHVPHLPNDLRDLIVEGAEGNPFFVEELIKMLIEDGVILTGDADWEVAPDRIPEIRVPSSLSAVLQARLDRLPLPERAVLQRASVIGREFWDDLVEDLSADETFGREVDELLASLRSREMVYRHEESAFEGTEEYVFGHTVLRDVTYESVLLKLRSRYHSRIARWLEEHAGDRLTEYLGLIASHYELAGEDGKAVEFLLRAGDRARSVGAYREAISSYERAMPILRESADLERAARSLMKLGLTYHNAFRFEDAGQAYEEGFGLWQLSAARRRADLPPAPHALRIADWQPRTLDPAHAGDVGSIGVLQQLYSGLVTVEPGLAVEPDVAHSWEVLDGGRRYVFHLRDDVTWSDGAPVTAWDFERAWRRVLDPTVASPQAHLLFDIRGARAYHEGQKPGPSALGIQVHDSWTFAVELEQPTSYFLQLLAGPPATPLPSHSPPPRDDPWTDPSTLITNGPFRLARWGSGTDIRLVRDTSYHGPAGGNVREVVRVAFDPDGHLRAFEQGALDVVNINPLQPDVVDRVRQRQAGDYVSAPEPTTYFIAFNARIRPFDDRRVRRALALAIDRNELANVIYRGQYFAAMGGMVPRGFPGHSAAVGLPYDPEKARDELGRAGYPGGRGLPSVEGLAPNAAAIGPFLKYLTSAWMEILGLHVTWCSLPFAAYYRAKLTQHPPIWWASWLADFADPATFLRNAHWCEDVGWRHPEYDAVLDEAGTTMDPDARLALCRQADRILVGEAPVIPCTYGRSHLLVKPWVRNPPLKMNSRYQDVIIDPH
jgi:ABC-type oligopeptide transport system substrate-binding subunit/class 3 adenylate cyclase